MATMRTNRRRTVIQIETLEGRAVPSTVLPVLTHHTLHQVLHQIDNAAGSFAKSHNANAFDASLSRISSRIPFGRAQLLPTWQADENIYDPATRGSGVAMIKQIKVDLIQYVKDGVSNGDFKYR
jgi:hypothetical protein